MKTLMLALVCAVLLLAVPGVWAAEPIVQKQISVATSNAAVALPCNKFIICNDGAANFYVDCDTVASITTGFAFIPGRCVSFTRHTSCSQLNYIGTAACTKPACLNVACVQ